MANYIDWYLIELEGRLTGRLPAERVFMVTSETEDHLRQKTDDLVAAGMPEANAQRTATSSFGSPARIAFELIEGHGSTWSAIASKWLIVSAVVITFGTLLISVATGFQPDVGVALGGALGAGIPCALLGSLLARRPMGRALMLSAIPVAILTGLLMPIGYVSPDGANPIGRQFGGIEKVYRQGDVYAMNASIKTVSAGLAAYSRLDGNPRKQSLAIQLAPHTTAGQYIVLPPVYQWSMEPGQLGGLIPRDMDADSPSGDPRRFRPNFSQSPATTDNLGVAEASWKANGAGIVAAAQRRLTLNIREVANLEIKLARYPAFSGVLFTFGALMTLASALALWGVNFAGIAVARAWRWTRVQRPVRA